MTAPNRATLWGETLVDELVAAGVDAICLAPGSRSTPLTVAAAGRDDVAVSSHLDERSAAFFALGRARRTGRPTAVVTTSGTAAANCHPAVIEADAGRVPLVVLTADRPVELHDSGANQTVDQTDLYGDAVRWFRTLPEPAPEPRRLRSLRTTACRAVATATGTPPGPVHLNVPVAKPLEPTPVESDVPDDLAASAPLAASGRDGPFVRYHAGEPTLAPADASAVARAVEAADRGLIVAGPVFDAGDSRAVESDGSSSGDSDAAGGDTESTPDDAAIAALARTTGFPLLADPLSGLRFGDHVPSTPVHAGYDSYLAAADDWPDPDLVVRFGASPTSRRARRYLRDADARQFLVDPAGEWPEATFTATDVVTAAPGRFARDLADRLDSSGGGGQWADRFERAEAAFRETVDPALSSETFEGALAATVVDALPDPATLFVSNSMPVRDVDRFARPRDAGLTVLGNRGASGIDGIVSTALGAGSGTDDPLVALVGDLAFYHDQNGLAALDRCGVDATIVVVDNDGGGIFHKLPVESFDPPFTEQFKTPHGIDFSGTAASYDVPFERVDDRDALDAALAETVGSGETRVLSISVDAEASHRTRERLHERVCEAVRGG